jgi:hypothetical protein
MNQDRSSFHPSSFIPHPYREAFVRLAVACLVPNQDARVRIPPNALPALHIGAPTVRRPIGRAPASYAGKCRFDSGRKPPLWRGQFREVGQVEWPRASEARERRFDSCLPD